MLTRLTLQSRIWLWAAFATAVFYATIGVGWLALDRMIALAQSAPAGTLEPMLAVRHQARLVFVLLAVGKNVGKMGKNGGKNGVRHDYLAPLAFLVCVPPFDAACRLPSFSI
jgi:hypothetical protein